MARNRGTATQVVRMGVCLDLGNLTDLTAQQACGWRRDTILQLVSNYQLIGLKLSM